MPAVLVMTLFAAAMRERFFCNFHISTICQQSHMSTNFKIFTMSIFQPFANNFACQPILTFSTTCRIWRPPRCATIFRMHLWAEDWRGPTNGRTFFLGSFHISKICQQLTFSPCPCLNHLSTTSHANQFQHLQQCDMKRHEPFLRHNRFIHVFFPHVDVFFLSHVTCQPIPQDCYNVHVSNICPQ